MTIEKALRNVIPVCSNCHRIIHRDRAKPLELAVLKKYIDENGIFRPLA
ncbi:MAG: hypothetical protein HY887_02465 [Deltaproteobacteria bacterium]|nr:hypothetical protein [Deltaproteobacteria bacterium]